MVTDEQVKLHRKKRMEGKTQVQAASGAGMSTRTARRWETGELPSLKSRERAWRTRADPFDEVWEGELVPLLDADKTRKLHAKSVLKHLRSRHPGKYPPSLVRTLQRRIRDWRALNGPPKEVVIPQDHPLGREAAFDFTHCAELGISVAGEPFDHLLFTLNASAGKWVHAELAFGETWEAHCRGLQNAMRKAGRVFAVWRHDNLSAATQELKTTGGRNLTRRYQELLDLYDAKSTRIQAGNPSENGGAEKCNDLLKTALNQAHLLRGHRDFPTVEAYLLLVEETVAEHNEAHAATIAAERATLKALPAKRLPDHTVTRTSVRAWSTIRVAARTHSVPSRLIGHAVEVHQHPDHIEVYFDGKRTLELPRLRGSQHFRID